MPPPPASDDPLFHYIFPFLLLILPFPCFVFLSPPSSIILSPLSLSTPLHSSNASLMREEAELKLIVIPMASIGSVFNKFSCLFILLLHLGCFIFTAKDHNQPQTQTAATKKRKVSPVSSSSSSRLKLPQKALSSSWSYIKLIFSSSKTCKTSTSHTHPATTPTLTSARSSQQSLVSMIPPETNHHHHLLDYYDPPRKRPLQESDISTDHQFSPLRNDIFPCPACGEIFQKPQLLEQHQAIKHAVSELLDGDSGKKIVQIIFKTGWSCTDKSPEIHRILKIHNSPKILSRFEEYREIVKAKAARSVASRKRDERCIADGNELLRFYCSTFMCDLGLNENTSLCSQQYCSVCGIIKSGFSPKLDGISVLSTSWRAHAALPDDVEEEFKFMNVKRAMLVCRVVAGRVGCDLDDDDDEEEEEGMMMTDKADGGFDSVLGRGDGVQTTTKLDEEELLVFNPRAVLPCFVIVYSV